MAKIMAKNYPTSMDIDTINEHFLREYKSYFFSDSTRRFFRTRFLNRYKNLYYYSDKAGFDDYRREYTIMVVTEEDGCYDILILCKTYSSAQARKLFYELARNPEKIEEMINDLQTDS